MSLIYVAALTHSGIQERQMKTLMSELEIPSLNSKTMKKRLKEIQGPVLAVAQASCEKVLMDEAKLSKENAQ